jgi:hypothetical protein
VLRTAATNRPLARVVQSTHGMTGVTDLDDRLAFVNHALLDGYGCAKGEVLERHV